MVEIGGEPFISIVLNYLVSLGFKRFILGLGYKADAFVSYFKEDKYPGAQIMFSAESSPLGTGGAVKNAQRLIKSNLFFVLNGDSFSKFSPSEFLRFHKDKKSLASLLLKRIKNAKDYGRVKVDKDSRLIVYNEKVPCIKSCLINAGVYIFDKKIFEKMPQRKEFSLEQDLFPLLVGKDFFGFLKSGYFIDIGTPERLSQAKNDAKGKKLSNL
jgi:NDP-sugar pyrophosphorylase family protein